MKKAIKQKKWYSDVENQQPNLDRFREEFMANGNEKANQTKPTKKNCNHLFTWHIRKEIVCNFFFQKCETFSCIYYKFFSLAIKCNKNIKNEEVYVCQVARKLLLCQNF